MVSLEKNKNNIKHQQFQEDDKSILLILVMCFLFVKNKINTGVTKFLEFWKDDVKKGSFLIIVICFVIILLCYIGRITGAIDEGAFAIN